MRPKPIIIIVAVLILGQILMFNYQQSQAVDRIGKDISDLGNKTRMAESEKASLNRDFNRLKKIVEEIPPWLLTGFEDPEVGFVEFLDFLQTPIMKDVGGKVTLGSQAFRDKPIPHHESGFSFTYEFTETAQAEKFLNNLLFQEHFPLPVRSFSAKKKSTGVVGAELSVALLVPARLKLELPAQKKQSEAK